MAKSQGDKVSDLEKLVAAITERLDFTDKRREEMYAEYKDVARLLSDCRLQYEREMALFKREVEDLKAKLQEQKEERKKDNEDQKKERDEWDRRKWAFGPNIVGALISVILGPLISAAVAYYVVNKHP